MGYGSVVAPQDAGTVEHLAGALERAAAVWCPESGTVSAAAPSTGEDTTAPVVASWPSWEDLTFGEFASAAEAAAVIPRLEFLRAAAPWECSAPGEKPLPLPKKSETVESMMEAPQASSVVLGNLLAAAVRGLGDDPEGCAARQPTAAARLALAAMVLDRLPVEMQAGLSNPSDCLCFWVYL